TIERLEKKTAALLAYLALEGPTGRSRIAGLLWPESREATARNNLAQVVRRLRANTGASLIEGDATLELAPVDCDVLELLRSVQAGDLAAAARAEGELLAGYDYDGCPELEDWLRAQRSRVRLSQAKAADAEIERLAGAGALDDAIALAERVVASDPLVESSHLRLARLWLARGDAAAAMRAYDHCKKTLARELAMKPSAAMVELYRAIVAGRPAARAAAVALPASVLRPKWVGRAKEWALLERAYEAQRIVIIDGEPGVGKSRLVRDFAQEKAAAIFVEGRVGDAAVPFATLARSLRHLFANKRPTIDGWARSELSRVVPELAGEDAGAPSMRTKVRLFEAVAHAFRAVASGDLMMVLDDLQWIDRASAEVFIWLADESARRHIPLRIVGAYRTAELDPEVDADIEKGVLVGTTVRISLGPLDERETRELVEALGIEALEGRAEAVARASRGIPLYALEIVRSMVESSSPADAGTLAVPERVRLLLSKRLERLSEPALRLARVIAVAGPEFDLDLAAFVLSKDVFDLTESLAELERTQIVTGKRLAHDLLADSVRESLPALLRAHIHGKTADYLKTKHADPARIAQHLEAAGRP
ncbi:MAG: AAA family ATPase, partial [Myxococcales bacterium]|nr:AAA family ATPase [Myxococcales bacterium]